MPITSWAEYQHYLREDQLAVAPHMGRYRPWHAIKYPTLAFQRKLRLAEYMQNRSGSAIGRIIALAFRLRARNAGMKLGFSIPPNVFGPGLSIAHYGTIVVNDRARVGARCRIHPGVVIGTKNGGEPIIGDDCYLGPGSKLIGGITLGDRAKVGANAVVTKSFPSDSVLVGLAARPINGASSTRGDDKPDAAALA